jgi:hypothetical protein
MSDDGYTTRDWTYGGSAFSCRFYLGFVSSIAYLPPGGGPQVEVYSQGDDVYQCPGGPDGPGPDPFCTFEVTVDGGAPVVLDVDDAPRPAPSYRGPVAGFQLGLQRAGGTPYRPGQQRVVPAQGADQVAFIEVASNGTEQRLAHAPAGGVRAAADAESGTVVVQNNGSTCPPFCSTAPGG